LQKFQTMVDEVFFTSYVNSIASKIDISNLIYTPSTSKCYVHLICSKNVCCGMNAMHPWMGREPISRAFTSEKISGRTAASMGRGPILWALPPEKRQPSEPSTYARGCPSQPLCRPSTSGTFRLPRRETKP
jgi:hypothetical protein